MKPPPPDTLGTFLGVSSRDIDPASAKYHTGSGGKQTPSLSDRADRAASLMNPCRLCFRQCNCHRLHGEIGYCGIPTGGNIVLEAVLCGEERIVNPTMEIFLSGCNLRCGFCYEKPSVDLPRAYKESDPVEVAHRISQKIPSEAGNVHWVGGEPTIHLCWILTVLDHLPEPVPVVWNSNMMMSDAAADLIDGIPDLILADIHFGNPDCAAQMGADPACIEHVQRQILRLCSHTASIIRYLYLPGHHSCCFRPIASWVRKKLPHVPFHIMGQYVPPVHPGPFIPANRPLKRDVTRAIDEAVEMGLNVIEDEFIPGTGPCESAGFETEIEILTDGTVTIQNFSGDFIDLARILRSDLSFEKDGERTKYHRDTE
jgi:putative pyruvate formate lyase activating enzyme